ncbi:DegT/DnrJ/EryC1/StrS family aminotransferase [Diaphorobacter sp. HDW4A]|uniref:DegT/DnrJ/EryC1/StrS family aminotransferase n=1 Tax=Diaphorobacter sp. HDW4A TaxID=2714924 RepID=UPI001409B0BC|nr:DegT/DnrJ/EryC1/StrS family aminotransferase [Diaphorobacter sp. HDW4A]QIL81311.1 DegT/DnrJ/EryC1/StrS family aminotransferase [Diaphorobacter sp. HDW4A]
MSVPFFRSPWQTRELAEQMGQRVTELLQSGHYILGPQVQQFERALAEHFSHDTQAVAVNSGTDALVLALQLLGLKAGDEVIVPAGTFIACYEAIVRVAATPVLVDSLADDFLCSAEQIERLITPRTRAVLAVPLFGDSSATPAIAQRCQKHDLALIEDIAQALGAHTRDTNGRCQQAGTMGDISTASFYPTKTLGAAGDAGAVISSRADLLERARALRNHGRAGAFHSEVGFNSRMDELQAMVLAEGIARLESWLQERRSIAAQYLQHLAGVSDVTLPHQREGHAWNYFVLRSHRREALKEALARRGIDTRIYYDPPIHQQPSYLQRYAPIVLPNVESHSRQALALPLFPGMTASEIEQVVEAVHAASNTLCQ